MSLSELLNYTSQNDNVAVAIKPIYINKTNLASKSDSLFMSSKNNNQNDYFVWIYKIIISNDSNFELNLQKYDLTTISEAGIVRRISPEQSQSKLINMDLKIKPNSVFETNDVISLSCRSGIMYGECVFANRKGDIEYKIKIPPISLDSGDSKKMAN